MDALKESQGIYQPIRVLFTTPVYERALQTCWHLPSYKTNIAVVLELLRLQQEHLLSPHVTPEDMTNLLLEKGKNSLRVQLWEFEIEDRDEDVAKPLLNLTWDVLNALKMRDVIFEARRLLASPWDIPASFRNPKLLALVKDYAQTLSQQSRDTPRLVDPREVVMEVVPKIIHGLWLPLPGSPNLSMPSKHLSTPSIGITQSVLDRVSKTLPMLSQQVHFTRAARDQVVQRVLQAISEIFSADHLEKRLRSFSKDLLICITSTAAEEICHLFKPHIEPETAPGTSILRSSSPLPLHEEELTEEPARDQAEEPAQDHPEQPAEDHAEESVVDRDEKTPQDEVEQPEEGQAEEPAEDHDKESAEDQDEEPAEDHDKESAEDQDEESAEDQDEESAEDQDEEPAEDHDKESAEDQDEESAEELSEDINKDTVVPDIENPAPASDTQPCVELPVSSTDVGVQTSPLPSPSSKGCIFCRFFKWSRKIYNNFVKSTRRK